MNVNNAPDKGINPTAAGPAKPAERAVAPAAQPSGPAAAPEPSVSVRLSPVTQTMTNNVARSPSDPFDAKKVDQIRTAIANGSFSPNAEAIADRMMEEAAKMLDKPRQKADFVGTAASS